MVKYSGKQLLGMAVDITKEYARGGGEAPNSILKVIYEQLKEINDAMEGEENK